MFELVIVLGLVVLINSVVIDLLSMFVSCLLTCGCGVLI